MRTLLLVTLLSAATATAAAAAPAETTETLLLRGHAQTLHLYDTRGGTPVIVSSGDGGWIHLGPHVAEALARHGFFVIGFDAKAYLSSFTTNHSTLRPDDEPGDYKVLADFAAGGGRRRPILVGVSEGAGLSVLAATDPATRAAIGGVVCLGLPDINEFGWRWKDAIIYVTPGAFAPARQTALRVADRSCWPLRCACWRSPSRLAAPSRYGEP